MRGVRTTENTLNPFYPRKDHGEHLNFFLSTEGRGGPRRTHLKPFLSTEGHGGPRRTP